MVSRHHRAEQYELLPRTSEDSDASTDGTDRSHYRPTTNDSKLSTWSTQFVRLAFRSTRSLYSKVYRKRGSRGLLLRSSCWILIALAFLTTVLIIFTAAFRPSYSRLPDHYRVLRRKCEESREFGRGNIKNEKIFIAASLYDPGGTLVGGDWGSAVANLVELLGPQNVHISVYENDASPQAKVALEGMKEKLQC